MMPPSIQVCPVEIPGRGRREQKAPFDSIATLANMLAHSLPLQVTPTNLLSIEGLNMLFRFLHPAHQVMRDFI